MKKDAQLEDRLTKLFELVNTWLKHAEAKSATLVAINGAVIFGFLRLIQSKEAGSLYLQGYMTIAIFFLSLSILILLLSFTPALSMPWAFKLNALSDDDNLLYFDHIAKYTPVKYLSKLSKSCGIEKYSGTEFEIMLSKQIIINSVICRRKYGLFTAAIWLTIAGLSTPIVALVIWYFKGKN